MHGRATAAVFRYSRVLSKPKHDRYITEVHNVSTMRFEKSRRLAAPENHLRGTTNISWPSGKSVRLDDDVTSRGHVPVARSRRNSRELGWAHCHSTGISPAQEWCCWCNRLRGIPEPIEDETIEVRFTRTPNAQRRYSSIWILTILLRNVNTSFYIRLWSKTDMANTRAYHRNVDRAGVPRVRLDRGTAAVRRDRAWSCGTLFFVPFRNAKIDEGNKNA